MRLSVECGTSDENRNGICVFPIILRTEGVLFLIVALD
jgi:hypothetical protein